MHATYKALIGGDPAEALRVYEKKLHAVRDRPQLLYAYARLLQELGREDRLPELCELLRADPAYTFFAAYQIGRRLMNGGRSAEAAAREACIGPAGRYASLIADLLAERTVSATCPEVQHIAICGTSYCGSTLLDRLLNGMDGVRSIGESHWLTKSYDGERAGTLDYLEPFTRFVPQCSVCGAKCEVLTPRFRAFLGADPRNWYFKIAHRLGATTLVSADKNLPKIVLNDPLLRLDALVLFKSPKQAWASELAKRRSFATPAEAFEAMQRYMTVWRSSYADMLDAFRPRGRKLFVDFDRLTVEPAPALRAIADGFGLPFEERALRQSIPGHSIGGNDGSMRRLRESNYAVRIEPLGAPAIPPEHAAWIDGDGALNELYRAMAEQAVGSPRGEASAPRIAVPAPVEEQEEPEPMFVTRPFALPTIQDAWLEGIFLDFGERARQAAARIGDSSRPALAMRRDFFAYLSDRFDATEYARLQRRHLVEGKLPEGCNYLKYLDTVRWIEGKFGHALELRLHRPPALDILDLGTGPGHFQVVAEYFGHRTLGLDVPLKAESGTAELHLYDDLCRFFGVEKVSFKIKAMKPLPDFGRKFDLVTSFMSWFHTHPGSVPWSLEEWAYFLRDVGDNVLKPGGRLYMNLVKEAISPEVWAFLSRRATTAVERNCTVLIEDFGAADDLSEEENERSSMAVDR
jgi:hypothetical protein